MDVDGNILDLNRAFTRNFGYQPDDLKGKNFSILFTEEDRRLQKPQAELLKVNTKGQANDENFIVDKSGKPVWCSGESILVSNDLKQIFIVKDVINLQERKHLTNFFRDTEGILKSMFENSPEVPMMILDGSLKVQMMNDSFMKLFSIEKNPEPGCRLADLQHELWSNTSMKQELRETMINNVPFRERVFSFSDVRGKEKKVSVDSKILDTKTGKMMFIMCDDNL